MVFISSQKSCHIKPKFSSSRNSAATCWQCFESTRLRNNKLVNADLYCTSSIVRKWLFFFTQICVFWLGHSVSSLVNVDKMCWICANTIICKYSLFSREKVFLSVGNYGTPLQILELNMIVKINLYVNYGRNYGPVKVHYRGPVRAQETWGTRSGSGRWSWVGLITCTFRKLLEPV